MSQLTEKVCVRCGARKSISEFHRHTRSKDGFCYNCKSCRYGVIKGANGAPDERVCPGCKERKPFSEYSLDKSTRLGINAYCRACKSKYDQDNYNPVARVAANKIWRANNKLKASKSFTRSRVAIKYGLTLDQYETYLSGNCGICGNKPVRPALDHDHKTGAVRDVLCSNCNTGFRASDGLRDRRRTAIYTY